MSTKGYIRGYVVRIVKPTSSQNCFSEGLIFSVELTLGIGTSFLRTLLL